VSGIEQSIADASDDAALAVIVITLSAGGLGPLRRLVRGIARDVPAAVVIAQHVAEHSLLPDILAGDTDAPVAFAVAGERLQRGAVYVCPAQLHLIVNPDATLTLSRRERLRFFRPSADWLFTSAAASFRERAFAIVMSGFKDDGARGCVAIREAGGKVIAQDPSSCERPGMPSAAIATGAVDFVLAPDQMPIVLNQLLSQLDLDRSKAQWDAPFLLAASPRLAS
jgi:two-component system chemotaxis response regulator CheB